MKLHIKKKKNPSITYTGTPEEINEIRYYAANNGFKTPQNLIRKALHQYMNRYPSK